ncbi:hypothetical protein EYF80_003450 [Liparis tanakae]|uniref:Uncharacterized protein n=1 Tax=Liparis tanakae TaxID=230148 RepID=A0A4Z2J7Q1_9TELE|nr:hypothetical protein EYF80_003450 [Liparis tanakae]
MGSGGVASTLLTHSGCGVGPPHYLRQPNCHFPGLRPPTCPFPHPQKQPPPPNTYISHPLVTSGRLTVELAQLSGPPPYYNCNTDKVRRIITKAGSFQKQFPSKYGQDASFEH